MALGALAGILGGGGGSLIGGALGGLGSLLGGGKQEDAAEDMLNFAKNMQSFVHDSAGRKAQANRKDARTAARNNSRIISGARDDAEGAADRLRNRSLRTAGQALNRNLNVLSHAQDAGLNALARDRRKGIADVRGNLRTNLADIGGTEATNLAAIDRARRQNMGDIRGTEARGLADIAQTRAQNLATARQEKNASLGYFEPAIGTGRNALSAFSDVLGLSQGGYDLALTPATQFLMEQGRDTVEGGAAGSGGLYSGETLAELEKMRTGLVSQDRQNQMAELMQLIGLGQSAGNSAAGVRSDFRDAATGIRTNAQNAGIGVRGTASGQRLGVRNDARNAGIGVRDASTGLSVGARDDATKAILGLRDNATQSSNAVRSTYAPQIVGVNDAFAGRVDGANVNYANALTNASDVYAQRGIANNDNLANRFIDSRNNAMNAYIGAMGTTTPMVGQGITNKGDAGAAQWAGMARSAGNALGDFAYWQGQQGGGATTPLQPLRSGWTQGLY